MDDANGYVLKLFVTGATPNSVRAVTNIRAICEKYLDGQYSLEIIDIYNDKEVAVREKLVALPMLLKMKPSPVRRLIGDLSKTQKVLEALGINEMIS